MGPTRGTPTGTCRRGPGGPGWSCPVCPGRARSTGGRCSARCPASAGPAGRTPRLRVELAVAGVTVDRAHLADYDRVCGFRLTDRLPATYPHVLGFPLALRLMTAPEFPFPLAGVVHVGNRITVHRPVTAGETARTSSPTRSTCARTTAGRQVDVVLVGSVGGEEVWRGVSTYLGRERGRPAGVPGATGASGPRRRPPPHTGGSTPRVGTEYARVSGDHNPIHTSRLGARLFGFPRPIAHGMWSKARCLAALESRLPEAYTVEVAFKLPVPLPSTVAFSAVPGRRASPCTTRGPAARTWWAPSAERPASGGLPHRRLS